MKREYTIDDRIDRLTMRDSVFYEANVAGSGSGMETEMWDFERRWVKGGAGEGKIRTFCGDIELRLCLVVPRRVRHGREGECGEEEEEEEERREEEQGRDSMSCSNGFLPAYSARSSMLLHPSRFLFRLNRLCFHFAAVDLF